MANTYFFNSNPITYEFVKALDKKRAAAFSAKYGASRDWSAADWEDWEVENNLVRWLYQMAKA